MASPRPRDQWGALYKDTVVTLALPRRRLASMIAALALACACALGWMPAAEASELPTLGTTAFQFEPSMPNSQRCQYVASDCTWRDPWTTGDTARQALFLTLLYIDYRQTSTTIGDPRYTDGNRILGPNPTKKQLLRYNLAVAVLHTGFSYVLPATGRKWFQYVSIAVEAETVYHNYKIGIRFAF
jgi:hypothetical protein